MIPDQSPPLQLKNWLPNTGSGFWRVCLLASLMVNLGVAGLLIGRVLHQGDRMGAGGRYEQVLPKKFFMDLPVERRRELRGFFHDSKPDFEKLRQTLGDQAQKLATELTAANYDASKASAVIDGFTIGADSQAAKSASLLKEFLAKLTPEERAQLAKAIQDRAAQK